MRQFIAAALLVSSVAACTATAAGTVTPGASTSPAASGAPSAAPSGGAAASATLDAIDLKVDGQPITIANSGTYGIQDMNVVWHVGQVTGAMAAGTWFVNWGIAFKKDPKAGGLTTADVLTSTVTLYKGTGTTPQGHLIMILGAKTDAGEVTVADGKATVKVNASIAPMGSPTKIKIEGSLAGTIK